MYLSCQYTQSFFAIVFFSQLTFEGLNLPPEEETELNMRPLDMLVLVLTPPPSKDVAVVIDVGVGDGGGDSSTKGSRFIRSLGLW